MACPHSFVRFDPKQRAAFDKVDTVVLFAVKSNVGTLRPLGYERVYLPLFAVADTPFHIQWDDWFCLQSNQTLARIEDVLSYGLTKSQGPPYSSWEMPRNHISSVELVEWSNAMPCCVSRTHGRTPCHFIIYALSASSQIMPHW